MNLKDIYSKAEYKENRFYTQKLPIISYEVFPPKDDFENKSDELIRELNELMAFNPKLISITYGAGGSTKNGSLSLTQKLNSVFDLNIMPHFTCVNASRDIIKNYMSEIEEENIENVLALRGDIPKNQIQEYEDFKYANELVKFIKENTRLSVAVAGYPEKHPESKTFEDDIEYLKRKVDEGAEVIFTQLFFDNTYFYDYIERVRKAGINLPVIPGILPITNYSQLDKMISLCGAKIPEVLKKELYINRENKKVIKDIGINYASYQVTQLIDFGVDGLHFYTLNKASAVKTILESVL